MDYSAKRLPGTLETVVFHELLRRGYKVSVGTVGKLEIDFLPQRKDEILSVQVATHLTEESTIEGEFGNLEKIQDNYPKPVLFIDEVSAGERDGIRWYQIRDWF